MRQKFYDIFIAPRSQDVDQRNRELILNWILVGIFFIIILLTLYTTIRLGLDQDLHRLTRLILLMSLLIIFSFGFYCARSSQKAQLIARWFITVFFFGAGSYVAVLWGIINPYGMLLLSLAIILSGILLGSRYSLVTIIASLASITSIEMARQYGAITHDMRWIISPSTFGDIVGFGALFSLIGVVSWLFNRQMETSLRRAQKSEQALKLERDLLEIKVAERTRELQKAQLEKMQHVYRFAELGHLSTALFHDLAGNLSSLSIDIESMRKKRKDEFSKRIDENIKYIDNVVKRVKTQIQGKDTPEEFNVISSVKDMVGVLSYNARKARTQIIFEEPLSPIMFEGNLTRFRQLIINLLSNAIEAYPEDKTATVKSRPVIISIGEDKKYLIIKVTDYGKGIARSGKKKIFDPFYSTKASGSGIGLFIVKQVTENDFKGKIKLDSSPNKGTVFTIYLPKNNED